MKILAFLQNQWFRDPAKARAIYEKYPEQRNQLVARFLFAGCLTGRRLRAAFGDRCDSIIWEETSPEIGNASNSVFEPDLDHMIAAIDKHKPDVIIAFGKVADGAMEKVRLRRSCRIVASCHPAARAGAPEILKKTEEVLQQYERIIGRNEFYSKNLSVDYATGDTRRGSDHGDGLHDREAVPRA